MRVIMAERLADALAMQLSLSTCSVKGSLTIYVAVAKGLTVPIKMDVISHFDAGVAKDAGLLLEGPGDLLFFVGYSEKTGDLRTALIDRSAMKRKPKDVMNSTGFVEIALKRFGEENAVKGLWKQDHRKDAWLEA